MNCPVAVTTKKLTDDVAGSVSAFVLFKLAIVDQFVVGRDTSVDCRTSTAKSGLLQDNVTVRVGGGAGPAATTLATQNLSEVTMTPNTTPKDLFIAKLQAAGC